MKEVEVERSWTQEEKCTKEEPQPQLSADPPLSASFTVEFSVKRSSSNAEGRIRVSCPLLSATLPLSVSLFSEHFVKRLGVNADVERHFRRPGPVSTDFYKLYIDMHDLKRYHLTKRGAGTFSSPLGGGFWMRKLQSTNSRGSEDHGVDVSNEVFIGCTKKKMIEKMSLDHMGLKRVENG
ncbi:hypothetical protein V8G54_011841 [Vigna mungo]|uniref:Uncharacterized protein n=1 Tax=Vigna mungo TaxID=3915 RepID=A0AAQ3NS25_VIGMU